ncbi:MAG TPA: threonyl-tRNA synthetase editing domain-containing protein, partial [Candidatus Bathyarchaeia archaeon]
MRILQLHSDAVVYTPIAKEINLAEEAEKKENRIEDVVLLLTAVEEGDDESLAHKAIDDVRAFLGKLKANRILIYPYAHLSNRLAKPAKALQVLKLMEDYAKQKGIETHRAPFGWNKQFAVSVKGHPLAEQSRSYLPSVVEAEAKKEETESRALKAEEKLKSSWQILQPDGKLVPVETFNFKGYKNLEKFSKYEIAKVRAVTQMPPH